MQGFDSLPVHVAALENDHVPPRSQAPTKSWLTPLLWVWVPTFALLILTWLLILTTGLSVRQLTQDPTTVMNAPFYTGFISNVCVVLWAATATISLFSALCLGQWLYPGWQRFLLASGLFTAFLLLDDLFLLHDEALPLYLGISGELLGGVYLLLMGLYLWRFGALIRQTNYLLFAAAVGMFLISSGIDFVFSLLGEWSLKHYALLVEDGAKLLGVAAWLAYFAAASTRAISRPPTAAR